MESAGPPASGREPAADQLRARPTPATRVVVVSVKGRRIAMAKDIMPWRCESIAESPLNEGYLASSQHSAEADSSDHKREGDRLSPNECHVQAKPLDSERLVRNYVRDCPKYEKPRCYEHRGSLGGNSYLTFGRAVGAGNTPLVGCIQHPWTLVKPGRHHGRKHPCLLNDLNAQTGLHTLQKSTAKLDGGSLLASFSMTSQRILVGTKGVCPKSKLGSEALILISPSSSETKGEQGLGLFPLFLCVEVKPIPRDQLPPGTVKVPVTRPPCDPLAPGAAPAPRPSTVERPVLRSIVSRPPLSVPFA